MNPVKSSSRRLEDWEFKSPQPLLLVYEKLVSHWSAICPELNRALSPESNLGMPRMENQNLRVMRVRLPSPASGD